MHDVCHLRSSHIGKFVQVSEPEKLFKRIVANLQWGATKNVRFIKLFKIAAFSEKMYVFFEKN